MPEAVEMVYLASLKKVSIIAKAVYHHLGPGLPDSAYRECFIYELDDAFIIYEKDPCISIDYKGRILEPELYACFIIDSRILVYIKSSSESREHHKKRLYNYMDLSSKRCGMLLDFNSSDFSGVVRVLMS